MKAMYINFIALLIVWLIMIVTGLVMWFALPGGGPRHGRLAGEALFWGLTKQSWEDIHKYAGIAFIILVGIHLILNWRWIVSTSKKLL